MQKQSDLLLNADDLDAMWVCLRENCVIDDATGAEKVCTLAFKNNCRLLYPCRLSARCKVSLPHLILQYIQYP